MDSASSKLYKQKNISNKLLNLSSLLLCLIPLTLQTGPFLPDLFLSIIALIFLYISLKEKDYKYYKNKFIIFFIFFYFYLIFNSILSENIIFSLSSSLFYFRGFIFALAVWHLINKNNQIIKYFSFALLISFIIAIISGYFQYIFGFNLIGINSFYNFRLTLPFNDNLIIGGYLSRLFPLLIALLIYKLNLGTKLNIFIVFILILTFILIFLSGERTAIALILITIFYMTFMTYGYRFIKIISLILSIALIFFIININTHFKETVIDRTISQVMPKDGDSNIKIFSSVHESHYIAGWKMFKDKPLLGIGVNLFRINCHKKEYNYDSNSCTTHPHNSYIQLLSETGIIGIIFLLLVLIYVTIISFRQIYSLLFNRSGYINNYQVCLLTAIILTIFPFLPTQNFFNNWVNVIYFLPVGFYLHSLYESDNNYEKRIN